MWFPQGISVVGNVDSAVQTWGRRFFTKLSEASHGFAITAVPLPFVFRRQVTTWVFEFVLVTVQYRKA